MQPLPELDYVIYDFGTAGNLLLCFVVIVVGFLCASFVK